MAALSLHPMPKRFALALSGGGDSVALMHLLNAWRGDRKLSFHALIVDHGLRRDSSAEAKRAARRARDAGWRTRILQWTAEKPKSNIEDAARAARYALLGNWCLAHRVRHLFVAHSQDDLVETFLLRLGRGSGVDGLSAMRARAPFPFPGFGAVTILRPLLGFTRSELRAYLRAIGADWIEDPMNENEKFSRVRIRVLMPVLEKAGVPAKRIADAARHLARAREALDAAADAFLRTHAKAAGDAGSVVFDAAALPSVPREVGLRALAELLKRIAGASYRPRFERLEALYDAILADGTAGTDFRARTLHRCRIGRAPKRLQHFGERTIEIKAEPARRR